ncbi:MAG: Dabb family protein [Lachnospirales bacterium]
MYTHYVTWNFVENIDKEAVFNEVKTSLESLKNEIEGIIEISFIRTNEQSTCDVVLLSTFTSVDTYKAYAIHPSHVKVAEFVKQNFTNRNVIDFTK